MIHPQLQQDCHVLGRFSRCTVLLNRNAAFPWFILVPDTKLEDVLDLPAAELAEVSAECQRVSTFLKRELGFGKVNFAGLGNVVPQMHLHVIGRSIDDPCWPQPVWGHSEMPRWAPVRAATISASMATSVNTRVMVMSPVSSAILVAASTASMIKAPTHAIAAGSTPAMSVSTASATVRRPLVVHTSSIARRL